MQRFLSQSFHVAEQFTGMPGQYVPLKETLRGFKMILNGECDELPFEERCKLNYDHPDAFDNALLIYHLQELKAGRAIDCPVYDYLSLIHI